MHIVSTATTTCLDSGKPPALPVHGRCRFRTRWSIEWNRLRLRPEVLSHATGWRLTDEPLDDLDQVLHMIGYGRTTTEPTEQALHALLVIAADDQLAARVVVQRLLPGLLAIVARRGRFGSTENALEELVGVAWIVIRTFNPERRPSCLAAALISDVYEQTFRSHRRRQRIAEEPIDESLDTTDSTPERSPVEELAELVADAVEMGLADDHDIELVRSLITEPRAIDAAALLEVTPRTYRNRRDDLTERLREAVLAA